MQTNAKQMQKTCETNDKKRLPCWQNHVFGFSRSAPGLATRAGRENDKKMRKTWQKQCKTKWQKYDNEMQNQMTKKWQRKQKWQTHAKPNDKKMSEKRQTYSQQPSEFAGKIFISMQMHLVCKTVSALLSAACKFSWMLLMLLVVTTIFSFLACLFVWPCRMLLMLLRDFALNPGPNNPWLSTESVTVGSCDVTPFVTNPLTFH